MREIPASEFKAHCFAILDEVAQHGEPVTILKRGKPVAQLVPSTPRPHRFPQETLKGTLSIHGDLVSPVIPSHAWEAERGSPR